MAASEPPPPTPVNERYNQLRTAGEGVLSGHMSLDDFTVFIQNISRTLAAKAQEIRDIDIPAEASDDFTEELEVGFAGIELYERGVEEMALFLQDQNPGHIAQGLSVVAEGNERINDAMRINRENRRKLEEMYIDTSTMM